MKRNDREAAYSAFVLSRQDHLRRVAYALCGDWHEADDLLQAALTKLFSSMHNILFFCRERFDLHLLCVPDQM